MAEAQAAAELRRKDPVKRAIWIGSFLVCVVVLWIANLQINIFFDEGHARDFENQWTSKVAKYAAVTNDLNATADINQKLEQLDRLSTNRFLWAPVFNALQRTMIEQVQVTRIKGEQTYLREDAKVVGTGAKRVSMPGGVTEKVNLAIEAKDLSPNEQNYSRFKESLGSFEFFAKRLGRRDGFTMDGILGPLTVDPVDPTKQFVTFTLASHFSEARQSE